MPINRIVHPTTGQTLYFGCRQPVVPHKFAMRDYPGLVALPTPPPYVDYTYWAEEALSLVLGNDTAGDCVEAGSFHISAALTANAGRPFIPTTDQVIGLYSSFTGYIPGNDSTDGGTDPVAFMTNWQTNGLLPDGSHKIAGSLSLDPANQPQLRSAIYWFENACFCVALPDDWINPFPSTSGYVWDVAGDPQPQNGHFFVGLGYVSQGVIIDSWGLFGILTWAAVAKYCTPANGGGIYTVLSQEAIDEAKRFAPNGLDWDQMQADFDAERAAA